MWNEADSSPPGECLEMVDWNCCIVAVWTKDSLAMAGLEWNQQPGSFWQCRGALVWLVFGTGSWFSERRWKDSSNAPFGIHGKKHHKITSLPTSNESLRDIFHLRQPSSCNFLVCDRMLRGDWSKRDSIGCQHSLVACTFTEVVYDILTDTHPEISMSMLHIHKRQIGIYNYIYIYIYLHKHMKKFFTSQSTVCIFIYIFHISISIHIYIYRHCIYPHYIL